VYVGGGQTPEQLVRTSIAEDATTLLVDGDPDVLSRIADLCARLGAGDVVVTPLGDAPADPRSP
jgi:methylmalonyl-CoA mutase C-terminal domain/subunit